ncbi:MAG TPA: sigma-70 family RNA polymerase sigma factor [Firmicutes bacterium]|nr:sigma-70 family RNA polymerase sigma factor [Bacillota bacterium]HOQ23737.1 sigma-70 family RNA polymerase sigma factor [Bacillota bacterium]HPT66881.1 sigma-70 family RNA polymerase sigma factor [Bacillota bacterium]
MLQEYLAELSRVKTLTPAEEKILWEKYKTRQDHEARQKLIVSYQPLVYKLASKLNKDEELLYDLLQEGNIGLIESVESFDHHANILFSTYAAHRIRGRMLNFLARCRRTVQRSWWDESELGSLWEYVRDEGADVENEVVKSVLHHRVDAAIRRLSTREQQVIRDLFINEKSPAQTAKEMDISLSYLYKIQKKALQRLRGMLSRRKVEIKYDA